MFITHIDVELPGFRFDQQEICNQFICEIAGFNEDTLAFILFLLNFSKFDAKISLRLVTQHCCGLKNDILLSRLKLTRAINLTKLKSDLLSSDVGRI